MRIYKGIKFKQTEFFNAEQEITRFAFFAACTHEYYIL